MSASGSSGKEALNFEQQLLRAKVLEFVGAHFRAVELYDHRDRRHLPPALP